MKTMIQALGLGLAMTLMLSACSNGGMQAASNSSNSSNSGNSGQGGTGGGGGGTTDPLQKVDLRGQIDGGNYDQVRTFDLDKSTGELLINLPLGVDPAIIVTNGVIPQLPGVSFYTSLQTDGNYYLVLRIPVRYILRGVTTLPPQRLPNGDPLPLMPAGELPAAAFALNPNNNKTRAYLYIGVDAIAVYVESSIVPSMPLSVVFPIRNVARTKVVGYFSMIPKRNGVSGGFFISTIIPADMAKILDDYFIR